MFSLRASVALGSPAGAVSASASKGATAGSAAAALEKDELDDLSASDYEARVSKHMVTKEQEEAMMMFFPPNDIIVNTVPRITGRSVMADLTVSGASLAFGDFDSTGFVVSAMRRYTRDYLTVVPRFDHCDGKALVPQPQLREVDFAPAASVSDAVEAPDPLDTAIVSSAVPVTPRKKGTKVYAPAVRQPSLFATLSLPSGPSDTREAARIPRSSGRGAVKIQALVQVKQIRFVGARQLEPLFLSVAVFNARKRERVTESVHIFLNPPEVTLTLGERVSQMAAELQAQRALFPLDDLSPDMFLVFFLEKTLRAATVDDVVEEQLKHAALNRKLAAKAEDDVRMSASRLGAYRQPFAWSARCLFEKGRSILGTDIVVDGFVRFKSTAGVNDALLIAQLEKMAERASRQPAGTAAGAAGPGNVSASLPDAKRHVPVQVVIDFDLVDTEKSLPNLILPSLEPLSVGGGNAGASAPPAEWTRVVQHFSSPENVADPNRASVNDMFLFLDWANFNKAHRRIRTVAVRVTLHDNDRELGAPGLQVFYGRIGARFESDHVCAVQYHERKLSMYEQVKICLPPVLHAGHHLLFTFSHVQCNLAKMKKGESPESVFGYATFPLFGDFKRIVDDGSYELPVADASTFPHKSYLEAEQAQQTHQQQQQQQQQQHAGGHDESSVADVPMFGFHTKLVSTMYTQDPALDKWFHSPINAETASCELLSDAAPYARIQFLPIILDRLWELVCVGRESAAGASLAQIAKLCEVVTAASQRGVRSSLVSAEHPRNAHLVFYVEYEYEEDPLFFEGVSRKREKPLYMKLMHNLVTTFKANSNPTIFATHLWFYFDVCVKSIVIALNASKKLAAGGATPRTDRVDPAFLSCVEDLMVHLGGQVRARTWLVGPMVAHVNNVVALFIKDLLSVVDRGRVMDIFSMYLHSLMMEDSVHVSGALQWRALRIVCDHAHFVPLNLPHPQKIVSVASIVKSFCGNHFLVGLVVRHFKVALAVGGQTRSFAVTMVRELLRKHDFDVRYKAPKVKKRVARMYLPLVLVIVSRCELIESWSFGSMSNEQREVLACFLWVLKHANRKSVLTRWWLSDTLRSQKNFLRLLQLSVKSFSGQGVLSEQACRVVLRQATLFMKDMKQVLDQKENASFLEELFHVFVLLLLQGIKDADLLLALFHSLREMVLLFATALFVLSQTSHYCGDLVFELLQYANVPNGMVRAAAAGLLFVMMQQNFAKRGNFMRMKLQATIAVSRFSGNTNMKQTALLEDALRAVANRAVQEFGETGSEVQILAQTLFRVIQDSAKIHKVKADRERMCDVMYQVSLGYALDSPDLRLTWLNNLADFHLSAKNYEEHAQCKLMAAALVCQYLHMTSPEASIAAGVPASVDAFVPLCPNVKSQPQLKKYDPDAKEEGMFESREFSVAGLMELFQESMQSLRSGQRYELAIQLYELMATMMQYQRKYDMLQAAFTDMAKLTRQLIDAEAVGSRSLSAFYRVSFVGAAWGPDLDGLTFIYKADEFSHIAEVTEQLEEQFKASFLQVERLGNKEIVKSDLLPDVCYWQIAAVKEYFGDDEVYDSKRQNAMSLRGKRAAEAAEAEAKLRRQSLLPSSVDVTRALNSSMDKLSVLALPYSDQAVGRKKDVVPWEMRMSKWERKFNVSRFILIQPFIKGKKEQSQGRPEDQWTRKTIYRCQDAFPFVSTRALVVVSTVQEYTPLETATEQIADQTLNFITETTRSPPLANGLQRVIQGAVLTQVNVGVLHTARVFLSKAGDHPKAQVERLIVRLREFLEAAEAAIALNKQLVDSEQQDLQQAFDQGLAQMKTQMLQLFPK